jgi:outer membrane protein assembly factor BamB
MRLTTGRPMARRLSRRALVAAAVLAPLAPARVAGQDAVGSAGVPMFRGNPARTGVHPGPGPAGEPAVRWQLHLAKVLGTTPAVVDGTVYIGSMSPGTPEGGALHAVDAATGIERWRLAPTPGDGILSSPAVVAGVAVVCTYDGTIVAADAATGEERWRYEAAESFYGSPAIVDGVVYLGDGSGQFQALDAATGEERWRVSVGAGIVRSLGSAAVVDGTVYCVDLSRRAWEPTWLHAWDAATGEERWRFGPDAGVTLSGFPVVADGIIYLKTGETLVYAVDAATGETHARFDLGGVVSTDLAVADGVIHAGTEDGTLLALDATTGETRWSLPLVDGAALVDGPTVADGQLYVNDTAGTLHAVDIAGGAARWSLPVDGARSEPAILGGTVYIGTRNGALLAIGGSDAPT